MTENHPVAAIAIPGSGTVPIAGNGTLMPGDKVDTSVPEIKIQGVARTGRNGTAAARLTDERAKPLLRVAATAPPACCAGHCRSSGARGRASSSC